MTKKQWLGVVFVLAVAAVSVAFAGSWPDAVMEKVNQLHDAEQAKKDMPPSLEGISTISGEEAYKLWKAKKAVFLDTRLKTQVDTEKIAGAQWLFCDDLIKKPSLAAPFDKDKEYVLYCNGVRCWRSPAVAIMLQHLGYKKLHWYRDGIPDWKTKGYPTE